MIKSRGNTNEGGFGISPVENLTKLAQSGQDMLMDNLINVDKRHIEKKHTHGWTFVKEEGEYDQWMVLTATYSRYVCPCGGMKRVKQFEVEE